MIRLAATAPVMLAVAVAVTACGKAAPPVAPRPTPTSTLALSTVDPSGLRTTTDMLGRPVRLPAEVRRVVALSPSAVEFADALGLEVVGRSNDAPGTAPGVGSAIAPDFNAAAALKPDLLIADAAYHGARLRDFDKFPYPVFVLRAATYDDVLAALKALGEATGRGEQAAAAAAGITARAAALDERVQAAISRRPAGWSPSVLIVTGSGREVYAGSDATYLGSLVRKLRGTNVLGAAPQGAPIAGFGLVELSQVASTNPDVVLCLSSGAGRLSDEIRASPAWSGSSAVKADRVTELDVALYLRSPGPRVAEALERLAALLYP